MGAWMFRSTFSLTSALVGSEWSASLSCRFAPEEGAPRYPFDRLGGPQSRSGPYGEVKFFNLLGLEQRPLGRSVHSE
jgi:hypothetical protein